MEGRTMRRILLMSMLVLAVVWGPGCIVIHTEEEPCPPRRVEPKGATIREIDAIGKLAFPTDRKRGYQRIARREGLSDEVQVYLIEAAFKRLPFPSDKVEVLLTLVKNPVFGEPAEAALLDRVDRLAFPDDKCKILDAIAERKG